MKEHSHRCAHCDSRWYCGLNDCKAPLEQPCPECFLAGLEATASVELARLTTRQDFTSWALAGAACLLMIFAALSGG